jgi:hypothetical protein
VSQNASSEEGTMSDTQTTAPRVKVAAAVPVIRKQKDLLIRAKGRLLALRQLQWYERKFDGQEEPTKYVDVGVIDLEGKEARVLGVVPISWKRVRLMLEVADPEAWIVGRLVEVEEDNFSAVELQPVEDLDLDEVAGRLERLETTVPVPHAHQLQLGDGNAVPAAGDADVDIDDDPF